MDIDAAADAIGRAAKASWWEWEDGSRPFHWRRPSFYRAVMRDGLQVYVRPGENKLEPQDDTRDPKMKAAMAKKLAKVRACRYIGPAEVLALTNFFAVPKGLTDIRMVYDGTRSGLNHRVWVPSFTLPTLDSLLRCVDSTTHMGDIDVGEMFLNFVLHLSLVALCGVDLTLYWRRCCGRPGSGRKWASSGVLTKPCKR